MTKINSDIGDDEPDPGGLLFSISNHLAKIAKVSPAIHKQFYPSSKELIPSKNTFIDPLIEDQYEKTKGLIHKYSNRALILLTMTCAAYCRFCTRRRCVSDLSKYNLNKKDINRINSYLENHTRVTEIIFSGGDPLTNPGIFIYALKKLTKIRSIKVVRLHTRIPISNPSLLTPDILTAIKNIKHIPIYISLHFEHPDEITSPTVLAINKLRSRGAILYSQSVFLKGINDSYPTLYKLFSTLLELGIRPYYLYHCDPVRGAEHFIVPLKKEIEIMTRLRSNLSGLACPTFVIDTPNGSGKIPVPLNFWQFNHSHFTDFLGKTHVSPQ